MVTRTITAVHGVEGVGRTVLVGLVCIDTLGIGETQFQTFQDFAPSKVVFQTGVYIGVRIHVLREITVVLQNVERIVLVGVALAIARTIDGDGITAHLFRNIARTGHHQVIVFFCVCSTHLQQWLVLLTVVTADVQAGTQPLRNLHIDTGTVVPTVVIQLAQITILLKVGNSTKVTHFLCGTADVHSMTHRATHFPIFVQQIHVLVLHGFQFVSLEQGCGMVQRGVRGVSSNDAIVQAAILIGIQHLGARDFVGETELSAIGNAGLAHLTFLGGHEDDTVSGTCSIDGSRSILQHRDALHFRRVEVVESLCTKVLVRVTHLHIVRINVTVDDEKGLLCRRTYVAERINVTDTQAGILAGARLTAADRQTVDQSGE